MGTLDAIILAGGLGTRLRGVINDLPKVLVPIGRKPFLDILLSFLSKNNDISKVVLAIGYLSNKIIDRYENCGAYGFEILFSVEKELLGTGGAIKKALKYTETENVLVLNGDSYIEVNIEDLFAAHKKNSASMTIVLKEMENAARYGSVVLAGNNRVVSFEEKNPGIQRGYVNAGIYLLKKELFDNIEENKVLSLERDLLPDFIKKPLYGYVSHGKFIDIGIPEAYETSHDYLKEV